jgi:diguanylate cyclase (GGDEF)-like protein/PAS domain S-box-containing protein
MYRGDERFREIFEFCPDGLFLVDANGVIQAMNRAMEVMTGWNREEVVGQQQCLLLFGCRHKEGGAICESTCPGQAALTHPAATLQTPLQIRTKQGDRVTVSAHYGALPAGLAGASSGYVIGVMRELSETKEMKGAAVMEAILDEQTGLDHFRYFEHQLQREIKRAERHRRPLSLMMIAIDDFQGDHPLDGPSRADEVIRWTATLIRDQTREIDLITRYGSETFLVLLPETEKQIAVIMAERLRKAAQASGFPLTLERPEHHLTVRIAIASYPWDAEKGEGLIRLAGQLLSPDKHSGKNRVHWKRL